MTTWDEQEKELKKRLENENDDQKFIRRLMSCRDEATIEAKEYKDHRGKILEISIEQRHSEIESPSFSDLTKLTQHFKCKECNIRSEHFGGCETCDYGSLHSLYLELWKFDSEKEGE